MEKKRKMPATGRNKTFAAGRSMNPPRGGDPAHQGRTKAFQAHDAKGRLGGFAQTGNHARTGNRGHL